MTTLIKTFTTIFHFNSAIRIPCLREAASAKAGEIGNVI
jgi:hypothetical protein